MHVMIDVFLGFIMKEVQDTDDALDKNIVKNRELLYRLIVR